ncbi:MAG: sigma-70 family RNA polymerase sigma factor [Actinomycetia bacterium]|nr:sigma-70 family RNA polymerase sigma factor [Actinomycetes bacterium]
MPVKSPVRTEAEISRLIEENLSLVNHVVFQVAVHFPRHVDRNELINAGAIGLVEAAKRYDEARGVPFNRFAAQRIRGAIIDAVRSADWAPRSVRKLARRLAAAEQSLSGRLGRPPSLGETAGELDMTPEELHALRDRIFRSVVLAFEHVVGDPDDDDLTLVDVLADDGREPDAELEERELKAYLREAIAHLPERHRLIILGYFIQDRTSADLARFLGVTESRVSQMRSEALGMLKRGIEAQYEGTMTSEPEGLVERRRVAYARRIEATSQPGERISERQDPDSDDAFCEEIDRLLEVVG